MSTPIGKLTYKNALERAAMIKVRALLREVDQTQLRPNEIKLFVHNSSIVGSVVCHSKPELFDNPSVKEE